MRQKHLHPLLVAHLDAQMAEFQERLCCHDKTLETIYLLKSDKDRARLSKLRVTQAMSEYLARWGAVPKEQALNQLHAERGGLPC